MPIRHKRTFYVKIMWTRDWDFFLWNLWTIYIYLSFLFSFLLDAISCHNSLVLENHKRKPSSIEVQTFLLSIHHSSILGNRTSFVCVISLFFGCRKTLMGPGKKSTSREKDNLNCIKQTTEKGDRTWQTIWNFEGIEKLKKETKSGEGGANKSLYSIYSWCVIVPFNIQSIFWNKDAEYFHLINMGYRRKLMFTII